VLRTCGAVQRGRHGWNPMDGPSPLEEDGKRFPY
jgi:hypothetical protein